MIRCNGGIILNEQLDELYSGYDGEVPEEKITEGDLEEFFGIESNADSEFEENLSEDDKYFLKLCKDRQRA